MTVAMGDNIPYFLQFLKNSGRIFVNAPRKNLTHRSSTTFGVFIIMLDIIPQLIAVDALIHTTILFEIYNHT